ncbi:XisH protein [Candidatus Electrothrix marina]|uniref:XisH protein n=1 Tax=Candidatus Electrothrix marina TaxID=1859130 RepID=A0A444J025_9BACT|nr:XisH protein [Candidatus Electrothrix marina]
MPAHDVFHQQVKHALGKEGWTVTHDPYWIKLTGSDMNVYIDLAAERILAAEKGDEKIAVEIKSFLGTSFLSDFHAALGQYLDYRVALRQKEPERQLFLAVPLDVYQAFFRRPFVQSVCSEYNLTLITFDPQTEEICTWIK